MNVSAPQEFQRDNVYVEESSDDEIDDLPLA